MPRFFVPGGAVRASRVEITGPDASHLALSLRARPGEQIVVVEENGAAEHGVLLDHVTPETVAGAVTWTRAATGEPRLRVHVLQALPRERMEDAIDAMVQTGVASIRPVLGERSVARPDRDRAARRLQRWRAVAREAAGLSGRGAVPQVFPVSSFEVALAGLPQGTGVIACTWEDAAPLAATHIDAGGDVALAIGPEGGLSDAEEALLDTAGAQRRHLGSRVLRTRLAGAVATALLLAAAHDLDDAPAPSTG